MRGAATDLYRLLAKVFPRCRLGFLRRLRQQVGMLLDILKQGALLLMRRPG